MKNNDKVQEDFNFLQVTRSEDLNSEEIKKLSVLGDDEKEIITKLSQNGAHLLQGARGVGKTMLLKMAEIDMDKKFMKNKILSVYVNFKTSTLLEGVKANNKDGFQIWVGAKILKELHEKLLNLSIISKDTVEDPYKKIFNFSTSQNINTILEDKIHLIRTLALSKDKEKTIEKIGNDFLSKVNDIVYVKNLILDIIKKFKLRRIVFLFDEAAHTFLPSQQEIFFEIFKLLHGESISIKAAVYPTVTSYGRNFEVGHDAQIIEMDKFDLASSGRDALRTFFRNILEKRISNDAKMKKAILSKGEVLDLCIYFSSGNPRAFFHLLNRTLDKGNFNEKNLLAATKNYVDNELLPYHNQLVKRLPKYASHVRVGIDFLNNYIIPEIRKKNNKIKKTDTQSAFFVIERNISPNLRLALDILAYSGILIRKNTVRISHRASGQRYMLHLSLMMAERGFRRSLKPLEIIRSISLKDYREFSANDSNIKLYIDDMGKAGENCINCSFELPANAKFCPECGTRIQQKSIISQLLDEPTEHLSISEKMKKRVQKNFPKVGDIIQATKKDVMNIKYIGVKRSKMIKNAADEFISG